MSKKLTHGWMAKKPRSARIYHYINERTMALCGRYGLYTGELMPFYPNDKRGKEDCAQCYKKAMKLYGT